MAWEWFWEYGIVILFYVAVIALIYFNRKKLQFEGKIIAMFRTKVGLKLMEKFSKPKNKRQDKIGGYVFRISLVVFVLSLLLLAVHWIGLLVFGAIIFDGAISSTLFTVFLIGYLGIMVSIVVYRQIKKVGVMGIYVGFLGMLLIFLMLLFGVYLMVFMPEASPLFSPIIPGVQVPGSPIKLPLVEGIISIFIVVVIHEFSHGVVSKAYGIPIKSSGLVMIGPLPGAFVEPDEKKLNKSKNTVQLSMFAAGPWSNILLFILLIVAFLFLSGLVYGTANSLYQPTGIIVADYINPDDALPGERLSMLDEGDIITGINDVEVDSIDDVKKALGEQMPGSEVVIITESGIKKITLTSDPLNENVPYLGLMLDTRIEPPKGDGYGVLSFLQGPIFWLLGLLFWIANLSLGIGLVNLLPIGPFDGGRMYLLGLQRFFKKKTAMKIWGRTSVILAAILAILIFVPIIVAIFGF